MTDHLIRYFDMFAGIGGFRAGLTRAGGFQCVGHCEINKYKLHINRTTFTGQTLLYGAPHYSVTVNVIEAIGRRIQGVDEQLRKEDAA